MNKLNNPIPYLFVNFKKKLKLSDKNKQEKEETCLVRSKTGKESCQNFSHCYWGLYHLLASILHFRNVQICKKKINYFNWDMNGATKVMKKPLEILI